MKNLTEIVAQLKDSGAGQGLSGRFLHFSYFKTNRIFGDKVLPIQIVR